jgi:hypothetical protein
VERGTVTTLAFIDTETTGLDPVRHEIWEVGMILRGDDWRREYVWQLPVDLGRADVIAMNIGGIRQRRGQQGTSSFHPGPDAFVDEQPKDAGPPMVLHPDALPWIRNSSIDTRRSGMRGGRKQCSTR